MSEARNEDLGVVNKVTFPDGFGLPVNEGFDLFGLAFHGPADPLKGIGEDAEIEADDRVSPHAFDSGEREDRAVCEPCIHRADEYLGTVARSRPGLIEIWQGWCLVAHAPIMEQTLFRSPAPPHDLGCILPRSPLSFFL
jgi:hypothetical protein